jgi:hypothetical protein
MVNLLAQAVARRSLAFAQSLAQPYADGSMNSLVIITRFGGGWNATKGEYEDGTPTVIYDDADFPGIGARAGITPTSGPIIANFGDENEYSDTVDIFIPKTAQLPMIDDAVEVTAGPDPQFVNRQYRVTSVIGSGRLVSSIHLMAVGTAPSRTTQ